MCVCVCVRVYVCTCVLISVQTNLSSAMLETKTRPLEELNGEAVKSHQVLGAGERAQW